MWTLLARACLTGIFGSAFGKWFLTTRMGIWFQFHLDNMMEFLAHRYNINIAKKQAKWEEDYPRLAEKIKELEGWSHPPVAPGGATELQDQINDLIERINKIEGKKK